MQRTKTDFEVVSNDKEFICSSQHWTNESGISIFFCVCFSSGSALCSKYTLFQSQYLIKFSFSLIAKAYTRTVLINFIM